MAQAVTAAPDLDLDAAPDDRRWMERAVCRGETHLFFPPHAERPQARERREAKARLLCKSCPVQVQCLWYARLNREYGFWGGESEDQRSRAGYPVPLPIGGRSLQRV
jgi:WhiB family transcriptional regulator, redox-sensing transcriptional regulator